MSDSVRPHRWQPTRLHRPWDSPGKNTVVDCHFLLQCVKGKLLSRVRLLGTPWSAAYQAPPHMGFSRHRLSGVQLCKPMDYSLLGSSVHGIFQARTLEWVGISFSGNIADSGIEPASLASPALAGRFFTTVPPWNPLENHTHLLKNSP